MLGHVFVPLLILMTSLTVGSSFPSTGQFLQLQEEEHCLPPPPHPPPVAVGGLYTLLKLLHKNEGKNMMANWADSLSGVLSLSKPTQ